MLQEHIIEVVTDVPPSKYCHQW